MHRLIRLLIRLIMKFSIGRKRKRERLIVISNFVVCINIL